MTAPTGDGAIDALREGQIKEAAGTLPSEQNHGGGAASSVERQPRGEPERSQKISIVEGSLATIHITITSGALLTAYALMLGANAFHLALITALTAVSSIGSVLGAQSVGSLGRRKPLAIASSVTGRLLWAGLCLLPFLDIAASLRMFLFLSTVLLGNTLVNISGTAWLSWMTDLVSIDRRGRYFGIRNTVLGGIGMITTFATGRLFDLFVAHGRRAVGLAVIFGAAGFFAALAGLVLTRQWEPPLRGERQRPLIETMRGPLLDHTFRRLLRFMVLWSLATGIAAPFFAAHMIRNLRMSFSAIAVYSIVAGVLNLITLPIWGRIIDRVGNRPVLAFNLVGVFILPTLWLFATPDRLLPIWLDGALTGLFWPGFTLAGFNLVLATAPEENRTAYLGVQSLAVGLTTFLASFLGGLLASALSGLRFEFLGLSLINYHVLFVLSSVLRIVLLPLALGLREERAHTVAALLDLVGDKVSQRFNQGWQAGVTIVRRIGRP